MAKSKQEEPIQEDQLENNDELEEEKDLDNNLDETSDDLDNNDDDDDNEEPADEKLASELNKLEEGFKHGVIETEKAIRGQSESSDDPVKLYLKEIGRVDLLDVDHEFWLATQVEAIKQFARVRQEQKGKKGNKIPNDVVYRALYAQTCRHWQHIIEDAKDLKLEPPEFLEVLKEAQQLQETWKLRRRSYLRNYLNNGMWSKNDDWDEIARTSFKLFVGLYLLPQKWQLIYRNTIKIRTNSLLTAPFPVTWITWKITSRIQST